MGDRQQQRLYQAERLISVYVHPWKADQVTEFTTTQECEEWLNKLIASAWFQRRWSGVKTAKVSDGRHRRNACGWRGSGGVAHMKMPRWARSRLICLHELTHSLAGWTHDWRFAAAYLELVTHVFGKEVGKELRQAYRLKRVKYLRPRKRKPRVVTEETLAVLAMGRARRAHKLAINRQRTHEHRMMMTNG